MNNHKFKLYNHKFLKIAYNNAQKEVAYMDKKVDYNNYNKNHYKNINVRIKPETNEMLESYCKDMNISKAAFVTNAVKYIIANNIDITL